MCYKVPILFLTFNRIEEAKRVFARIKAQKPCTLFFASDGPRSEEEALLVEEVRKYVLSSIDWDVELVTIFNENNLGCRLAVSSAINKFFANVEYGLILEDDCLPSNDFFSFAELMLFRFKEDKSIFHISGTAFEENESMILSCYPFVWGWATWADRWAKYDVDMKQFNFVKDIRSKVHSKVEKQYWSSIFEKMKDSKIDTWDYQWLFTVMRNNGVTIIPPWNMIQNIGFNSKATHTKKDVGFSLEFGKGDLKLIQGEPVSGNDRRLFDAVYYSKLTVVQKLMLIFKSILKSEKK